MALSYQKTTKIDSNLQYSCQKKKKKSSYFVYICFSGELYRLCKLTVLTGIEHLVQ
uniref:Alternative protein NR3C1 n=1 Tax=Homo sapiens TaxID=9606 RepID=L8E9L6_HUMAN|nr:alternative protein NR3C1 [Homo sapiens]